MNESGRFSLTQLEEGQTLIPRKNEINEILAHLDEAIKKKPYGKKHLVIVKGPAGIGKTTLLEMLRTDLLEEGNCRVTDRLDFGDLLKEDDDNPLLSAFEKCAGSALGRRGRTALDKRANAAQAMFEALNPTETSLPLIVFIDGLEQGLPLSLPPNKKKRVSEVCNLLIELLLRRPGLPAFIIAAARTTPDQPLPFLARAQWTASRVEICLMAFDSAQIQAGPAKDCPDSAKLDTVLTEKASSK